jgi:hypothetical protein
MIYKIFLLRHNTLGKVIDDAKLNGRENAFSSVEEAYEYLLTDKLFERMEFTILPYLKVKERGNWSSL